MIDFQKVTIDLQATEQIKPINEIAYGSIFVLGEEVQEDKFLGLNNVVISELLKQPLMKIKIFLSNCEKNNVFVGLYDGSVYAVDKNVKCKLISQKWKSNNENN